MSFLANTPGFLTGEPSAKRAVSYKTSTHSSRFASALLLCAFFTSDKIIGCDGFTSRILLLPENSLFVAFIKRSMCALRPFSSATRQQGLSTRRVEIFTSFSASAHFLGRPRAMARFVPELLVRRILSCWVRYPHHPIPAGLWRLT